MSSRRRWTTAGLFIGVGLIAWLASMVTGRVARTFLALPDGAALAQLEGSAPSRDPSLDPLPEVQGNGPTRSPNRQRVGMSKRDFADPILARNIFDSANVGASVEVTPVDGSDRKSDLKVVLLATVVAIPAEYSSALIAEEKGSGALGYGIGDSLMGEGTIVGIDQKKVYIRRNDGEVEYIAIEDGKSFIKEDTGAKDGKSASKDSDNGVEKVSDTKFVVDQEVIDKIMENPENLYSKIRVVPHKGADGEIDGYRVSGIRRKSFFHSLGVKNGDIVHSVNGKGLTSMSEAMDAYNSLTDARDFTFELTRRNQKRTHEYEIR